MIDFLRGLGHPTVPPSEHVVNGHRDERLAALQAHQNRVLRDLSTALDPDDRAQLQRLMDDQRFLESRYDA